MKSLRASDHAALFSLPLALTLLRSQKRIRDKNSVPRFALFPNPATASLLFLCVPQVCTLSSLSQLTECRTEAELAGAWNANLLRNSTQEAPLLRRRSFFDRSNASNTSLAPSHLALGFARRLSFEAVLTLKCASSVQESKHFTNQKSLRAEAQGDAGVSLSCSLALALPGQKTTLSSILSSPFSLTLLRPPTSPRVSTGSIVLEILNGTGG